MTVPVYASNWTHKEWGAHVRQYCQIHGYTGRQWSAYFHFVNWRSVSLGLHVDLRGYVDIHLPFGFIRLGRTIY